MPHIILCKRARERGEEREIERCADREKREKGRNHLVAVWEARVRARVCGYLDGMHTIQWSGKAALTSFVLEGLKMEKCSLISVGRPPFD